MTNITDTIDVIKLDVEQELYDSKEKFAKIFDLAPLSVVITSVKNNKIVDANALAVELYERPLNAMVGRTSEELDVWANPLDREKFMNAIKKDGFIKNFECKFKIQSKILYVTMSGALINLHLEPFIITIIKDITDRVIMEKNLLFNEKRFENIAQNISEVVVEIDPEYIIKFVNKKIIDIMGYTDKELIGTKITGYLTKESIEKYQPIHDKMAKDRDESTFKTVLDFIAKSGDVKLLDAQLKMLFNGTHKDEDIFRIYMVARDVTEIEKGKRINDAKREEAKIEIRQKLSEIETDLKNVVKIQTAKKEEK